MTLKYVGPKPIISHTGIEFDQNKDDKYIYLNIIVQFIKALDHEYIDNKIYTFDINSKRLSDDEIFSELSKYCPDIKGLIYHEDIDIEEEIEHNIKRAHENRVLTTEDKIALENNIMIMRDYLIQRAINKKAYYCAVGVFANLVKKDNIDYIVTPMYQKFAHALHSVQGLLQRQKAPIDTKLEIYQEGGKLLVKLDVINRP